MARYRYLLFDLDDTLLDFSKAESVSFRRASEDVGLEMSDGMLLEYKHINEKLWKMLERKEITLEKLKTERFRMVLLRSGYPECDETFSLAVRMRDSYMRELAECGFAVPGARETLAELGKAYGIYVITNGIDWIQKRRIERSGLGDLFKGVFVSEAAGYSKPDPGFFEYAVSHVGDPDRSAYAVIGDSLTSDCDGAMGAGMDFIWHNPKGNEADRNGHFGRRIIVAEYRDISALPGIIESL